MAKERIKHDYVDNKKLLAEYIKWREQCIPLKKAKLPLPVMPNYIAQSILDIANHLSWRPNFVGYSYRDEMVMDGVENCLQYLLNFNPEKSPNIFSYITTICYYAFVRRITKEKKQTLIKARMIQQMPIEDILEMSDGDDSGSKEFVDFLRLNNNVDTELYDQKQKQKRLTRKSQLDVEDQIWEEDKIEAIEAKLGDMVQVDQFLVD